MSDPRFTRLRDQHSIPEPDPVPTEDIPRRRRRFGIGTIIICVLVLAVVIPIGNELLKPLLERLHLRKASPPPTEATIPNAAIAAPIQVNILNACGANGAGTRAMQYLRSRRVDVTECSTAKSHLEHSVVIDRVGNKKAAEQLARAMNIPLNRVRVEKDSSLYVSCTVVLGADYRTLAPFR